MPRAAKLLEGQTIVVLGAGPAIGRETALMCSEEGASVVLAARSKDVLDAVAKEVAERGGAALPVAMDMTVADDCARLVEEAVARFGRVDGLVAVGYRHHDNKLLTECEDDLANWRPVMDTNFFGSLQAIKPTLDQMIRQGEGGRIVIVNSMTSHLPWPRNLPYAASKAALAAATRSLALEYGEHGIRVNSLHCGAILNEGLWITLRDMARRNGTTPEQEYEKIAAMSALRMIPTPEEYVGSVLYLLSDLSRPVTGASLHVNAGRYLG
jgi:NAD(P)-dependent dehydrogenase (short-subunit alcohol dehydrogenase family)